jgi:hypothetical protein
VGGWPLVLRGLTVFEPFLNDEAIGVGIGFFTLVVLVIVVVVVMVKAGRR